MNWKEVFNWYWEQKGVENPERFLEDENTLISQLETLTNENPEFVETILNQELNNNNKSEQNFNELIQNFQNEENRKGLQNI